jgi:hypothetical protein
MLPTILTGGSGRKYPLLLTNGGLFMMERVLGITLNEFLLLVERGIQGSSAAEKAASQEEATKKMGMGTILGLFFAALEGARLAAQNGKPPWDLHSAGEAMTDCGGYLRVMGLAPQLLADSGILQAPSVEGAAAPKKKTVPRKRSRPSKNS